MKTTLMIDIIIKDSAVVEHVPIELSRIFWIGHGCVVTCDITGYRKEIGLKVSRTYTFTAPRKLVIKLNHFITA